MFIKIKKKILILFFFGLFFGKGLSSQTEGFTQEQVDKVVTALFNPTLMSYPTTSLNEQSVELLFGPNGLNVGEPLLTNIKKFYFYLEYITHLELAAQLLTLAKDNELTQFTQSVFSWTDLVESVSNKVNASTWQELLPILQQTTPNWTDFKSALGLSLQYDLQDKFTGTTHPVITFNDLLTTSFWKAFPITTRDIVNSNFWQNYLKFTIYGTFQIDHSLTKSIDFNQNLIFKYIPKIEIGYYSTDFTKLRNQNELLRVSYVLNESYRKRLKNNTLDWKDLPDTEVLTAAQDFITTQFHQVASAATDVSLADKNPYSPYTQDAQGNIVLKSPMDLPSPYPEYVTCLAMIMMLQRLTYALFEPKGTNVDALTNTIKTLKKIENRPIPNFLVYDEEDYLPLEDLTTIIKMTAERGAVPGQAITQSLQQSQHQSPNIMNNEKVETASFIDEVSGLIDDIEEVAEDSWATLKDIAEVTKDEAEVFYYSSGLAEIIQGLSDQEARNLSDAARAAENKDWEKFRKDADKVIKDAVQVASWPGKTIMDAILGLVDEGLEALGLPETDLQTEYDKFMNAAVDTVTDALIAASDIFTEAVEAGRKLTIDGIALITHVAGKLVTFQTQNLSSDFAQGIFNIVDDVVTCLVETVELAYQDISKFVKDVFTLVASMIQILTDMLIDIVTFTTEIASALFCVTAEMCDPAQVGKDTAAFLENHKNMISQIITTGLIIGATIATGGGALAAATWAGMGLFAIAGGYQEDEEAIDLRSEQQEFLDDYTTYLVNKEQVDTQQQQFITDELSKKFGAEINNRERSVGFYQNYLNDTLIGIRDRLNQYIGSWQAQLLTPRKETGLVPADVGSLYAFTTGFTDLNITQGFSLYNVARNTLSQEIAETPKHTISNPSGQGEKISTTKFWFNQRIAKDLDQNTDPLNVEVRFRVIYLLNNFYIGLYLGGSPLDKNNILQQHIGNLDQPHLAKMFVYSKEGRDEPINLGIYEFETELPNAQQNWLITNLSGPSLSAGIWYHMKASLGNDSLQVKVWQENQPEPGWQEITITPCPQQTFGMIFSGAAGEFQVVSPEQTFTVNTDARPPKQAKTEKEREVEARIKMNRLMTPQNFTTFNLEPMSIYEIIKGHYLYQLPQNDTTEYMTTGNFENNIVAKIGQEPTVATDALVDLVTGKAYQNQNDTLQEKGWAMDIASEYKKTFINLNSEVQKKIDDALSEYAETMMGPSEGFPFGSYKVTPADKDLIRNHRFIYIPINTGPILKYNDITLTDDGGNTLYDSYFVFTLFENNTPETGDYFSGMSYQDIKDYGQRLNKTICMLSLVTGDVYIENQDTPATTGYVWDSYIDDLPADIKKTIKDAQTVFNTAFVAAMNTPPSKNDTDSKDKSSTDEPTGGGTSTSTGGIGWGGGGSGSQNSDESMNDRQTDAGGDDFGFGT